MPDVRHRRCAAWPGRCPLMFGHHSRRPSHYPRARRAPFHVRKFLSMPSPHHVQQFLARAGQASRKVSRSVPRLNRALRAPTKNVRRGSPRGCGWGIRERIEPHRTNTIYTLTPALPSPTYSPLFTGYQPRLTEPTPALGRGQAIMAGAACTAEPAPHAQASALPARDFIGVPPAHEVGSRTSVRLAAPAPACRGWVVETADADIRAPPEKQDTDGR